LDRPTKGKCPASKSEVCASLWRIKYFMDKVAAFWFLSHERETDDDTNDSPYRADLDCPTSGWSNPYTSNDPRFQI
jgi:hypothetical protein